MIPELVFQMILKMTLMLKQKFLGRLFILSVFWACFIPGALAQDPHIVALPKSTKPLHLYVQFESHPHREAVVSWATTLPGKNHVLYYDTKPRNGKTEAYANQLKT